MSQVTSATVPSEMQLLLLREVVMMYRHFEMHKFFPRRYFKLNTVTFC